VAYKKLYLLQLLDNIKHFKFAIGAFANTKGILANTVASLGLMVIKISEYQAVAAPQLLWHNQKNNKSICQAYFPSCCVSRLP